MSKYIKDALETDVNLIGAKSVNLLKLSELDINVPKFICISSELFDCLLNENKQLINDMLSSIDFDDEKSIREYCEQIQKYLRGVRIPESFEHELEEHLNKKLKGIERFSVRSSSLIEDNDFHTFAGQFATYLNVAIKDLIPAIIKCFGSLYSVNVLKYVALNKINLQDLKMGVIIQEMIVPETSGVIFTSNPQGLLNETVIINGKGTGNYVVEDKISVTTYYYNKTDGNYYYETTGKSPVLSNELIEKLMDCSYKISKSFGEYIDIEYAIKKDQIYILQARPITTISDDKLVVLDNSNIVESYPNITLPLTYSFIKEAYTGVFKNVTYLILKNNKFIDQNEEVLTNMLGSVNGRVYYKISNWYTLIKFLPFSKKIIPIWQDMMGVKDKKLSDTEVKVTFIQSIKTYINFFFALINCPKNIKKLEHDFNEINNYFYETYNEKLSNNELCNLYDELKRKILNKWGVTLLNDNYAFIFTGLLKSTFKNTNIKNYEEETNKYISGISNIESIKPIKELIKISNLSVKENVTDELKSLKSDNDVIAFLNRKGAIQTAINDYLDVFGDRSLEELKLESKTFRVSPILLINKIIEYTDDQSKLERITISLDEEPDKANIIDSFGILKRLKVKFLSKRAMLGIKNREMSRLNRSRIYGMVRSIFLSIAKNFKQDGLINDIEDIFYLKINEVLECIEGKNINIKELISIRKREFDIYSKLPLYSRLVFTDNEWNKNHKNVNSVSISEEFNQIVGTPCSNGVVTGEVIVINNPNDARNVKDKILVTKMTDPGWVFLLTIAKGIITEKGSLLSHTAIISRELKIPSIVGVNNITKLLKTGDTVKMDGNTGVIEKVSE